jgi:2-polyprenyl-3-methyl-5-hydroxy-6-metoxy-1,4-benzoquinol methylase
VFDKRSDENEIMDDLSLKGDDLRKNLDELEYTNRWFGSKKLLLGALNKIHKTYLSDFNNKQIVIGDFGCGGGDLLRIINHWAKSKKISVKLIGFDANPFMIQYAIEKSHSCSNIDYQVLDIYSLEFKQLQFDIIILNSLCHHFSNPSLITLYQQLITQTRLAIIINDLQRHWISYYAIKWLSKLLNFSNLAKHDGALSVLRAFRKQELVDLLCLANIPSYQIRWRWAFRWELIIWLSNQSIQEKTI